jgi:hypothetical protein
MHSDNKQHSTAVQHAEHYNVFNITSLYQGHARLCSTCDRHKLFQHCVILYNGQIISASEDFSSSLCVQTDSEAHPASCLTGTGGSFPGGKARPGRDADHSSLSSAVVENE